jgi:RimJ/RimL family protein N-acetyltransferase
MIETERLLLRPWREGDRAPYLATCNTPAVTEHVGGPASEAQIDAAIARIHACQAARGHCYWAIERAADGAFLGYCGLRVAEDPGAAIDGEIEIGWRLREDAWGQGYALEAARASLAWGSANLSADRIVAITNVGNIGCLKLIERLGMQRREELDFSSADDSRWIVHTADRE